MIKPRVYLDSTTLITFVFGASKEPDKFKDVEQIFNCEAELVTSIYSLIELYNFPIYNFEHKSDIPHAISAFIERCDYIVTFDSHFKTLIKIKSLTPAELLELMKN